MSVAKSVNGRKELDTEPDADKMKPEYKAKYRKLWWHHFHEERRHKINDSQIENYGSQVPNVNVIIVQLDQIISSQIL